MQRWRFAVLGALVAIPILVLIGLGLFYLWITEWAFWAWWPLMGCFVAAYFLAWRWQARHRLLPAPTDIPLHWTDRDRQGWLLVEARALHVKQIPPDQLLTLPLYLDTAQQMAMELARFYHPRAKDPLGALTIPEILTVVELAAHDLSQMVDQFLPGGHLLTINDMRRFKLMADWYPTVKNIGWVISSLFTPVSTGVRYLASQAGMTLPWQMLQENVQVWFFTAYIHRMGNYLIDLNSGRLAVGARRYQQLQKASQPLPAGGAEPDPANVVNTISFVLTGQAKAGKSSLINALLGEQKAITDVLPCTDEITRYDLHPAGIPNHLHLLDTVGYGNAGPREDQRRATEQAVRHADIILLVLHARNPARQADVELLQTLGKFFASHPDLRKPPILGVLTHIDLLSPSLEWAPPYDWKNPTRVKEQQIADAVAAVYEQLGGLLDGVVPVCTASGKVYGIEEWLLPTFTGLLDQAHAVAFLRCIKAEVDTGKARKVFHQLLAVFKGASQLLLQGQGKPH